MARYRVQGPDGAVHVFDGPDGATPDQVAAVAQQQFGSGQQSASASAPSAPRGPVPPQQDFAPDDPGVMGSALIGAGRTTDRVLKGLQQAYLEAKAHFESPTLGSLVTGMTPSQQKLADLKTQAAEDDRLYAPLQAQHPIATAVGESLPSMVIPAGGAATLGGTIARVAAAGAIPGALEYGDLGDRAARAAGGAVAGVVGGVALPKAAAATMQAVPALGRAVRAAIEPLYADGRSNIVGRTLTRAAGDYAADAAKKMAAAGPLVPGSLPTAAQVAENGGIAALERSTAQAQPADFAARGIDQSAARLSALRGIAQDEPAMANAVAAREAAAAPSYAAAKADNYVVDPRLQGLLQTPIMQSAMKRAETVAANDGRPFSFYANAERPQYVPPTPYPTSLRGVMAEEQKRLAMESDPGAFSGVGGVKINPVRQITGQGLQDLKMAVDEMLSDPTTGLTGKAGDQVRTLRGQLLNWMENSNASFKTGRETYRDMSAPINQMQIGQELVDKLAPALTDFGAIGKEAPNAYATALRNAPATVKNATKFPGASIEDIMTPAQMDVLNGVGQDLARKSNAENMGRGVGSDTFQKGAMANIAEQSGAPGIVGGMMKLPGVNFVARHMYSGPDEQIQSQLARALLDPQNAAALMSRPGAALQPQIPIRDLLLSAPSRAAQLGGNAGAQALARLFAQ